MSMNIYWTPYDHRGSEAWVDLAYFEPEPMLKLLAADRQTNPEHLRCYALLDYFKNTFVLRSPVDYKLFVDDKGNVTTPDHNQEFFHKYVVARTESGAKHRTLSLEFFHLFFATESVMIEAIPVFLDHSLLSNQVRVMPGTFDIGRWVRPVTFAFEVVDGVSCVDIKRGDPIVCVRFLTNEKVKFVRAENSAELQRVVASCIGLKRFVKRVNLEACYDLANHVVSKFQRKFKRCPFSLK